MALHGTVPIAMAQITDTYTYPNGNYSPIYGQHVVTEVDVVPFGEDATQGNEMLDPVGLSRYFGNLLLYPYIAEGSHCLLYTSPSPRDRQKSRMPSSA